MEEGSKPIEDLDPYAPYEYQEPQQVKLDNSEVKHDSNDCLHQVICPNCESTWHVSINKINL
ncbi:hypothetical protein [Natranaerobius thermophilus]|uniref:Uncharacterized protein n=1 Tax=Natranaerobius thermophilus (strain ATCC BAA-1301 / DSM 18059 / JW/NM-WN-LF) TaxID=457570 RepID=B2A3X5_NATTJ|nr:hypothetical protein [Natranaerobius thermophilus]ACB85077.1 hypothetical protein Nther_1494 [Natranaerobius thermophilus JW/NM-WN-LF]